MVHIDKLKLYQGPELKSWITFPNSVIAEEIIECDEEPVKINKEQENNDVVNIKLLNENENDDETSSDANNIPGQQ